jgi:autotransporter-associated beta strand protein
MKHKRQNPLLAAALTLTLASPVLHAAALTWDADSGTAGTQDGGGTWATAAGNWSNTTTSADNVNWANANFDSATFGAGTDGTYGVSLSGTVQAGGGVIFANSGYTLSGTALLLNDGTNNASITVNENKTATINSVLTYLHNKSAAVTVNSGGVLNLSGGTSGNLRPQWNNFSGAGTVNFNGGTFQNTIGSLNIASINLTAGVHTMTDQSANVATNIGSNAGRNVNYTVSGTGTLNVIASNTTAATYTLSLGRNMGDFKSTLTLQSGGTVNVGVTSGRAGQINLGSFDGNGNSLLDVQGGTLTVGTGKTTNKLYFFAAGANAGKTATMTQSGGTATINGIQFGANTGDSVGGVIGANTYAADSSATLQLSGGSLYVGTQGITRGSAAAALPVTIQLQGGALGASQNWSSSLDMKLGAAATIRAADSGGTARNITLSGILSDDGAANGTLTKAGFGTLTLSGANSYTGGTTVNAGTLLWSGANNLPTAGTLQVNAGGNFSLADGTARSTSTAALGLASGAMLSFDWNAGSVDTLTSTAAATTEGVIGLVINNTSPTGSGGTLISSSSGGLTTANGTQYLLANNTNYTAALTVTDTAVSIGAQSPATPLTDAYWVGGQVNGAPGAMNLSNGITSNWATDATGTPAAGVVPGGSAVNVIFGATGAAQQANVATVTDLNLRSITFNDSEAVTLGGSYFLTLNSTSATAATSSGAGTPVTPGSAITVTTSANATNAVNANLILAANQTWNIAGDKSLTVGGAVSGTATLTKADGGTLVLTGTNTYTGGTTVGAGTMQLGGTGQLGSGSYAGAISIGSGATFENAGSATQTLSGAITGTGGTVKMSGNGQFILSNSGNSYGALRIGDGRVFISSNAAALPSAATVSITGGILVFGTGTSYANSITVQDGGGIATRNSAAGGGTSLSNVTLPGSGTVSFNNDDARTYGLSIASDQTLTGDLTVQIGGNRMTANTAGLGSVTLSGNLTGSGGLTLVSSGNIENINGLYGSGKLTLTGQSDYTGTTTVASGSLIITGAVASTSVVVDGSLGGSGVMANATLSGSGSVNPGNSPGILTAAATDPAGGLDYNFEFTAANALPTWNAPAASGNDVLRLTDASTPFTDALGGTNTVTIYLDVPSLAEGNVFTGGFYTDKDADFLSAVSSATFQYFLADDGGATIYGGNAYTAYTGPFTFSLATVAQPADFGAGEVNGYVTQFTVIPEPRAALLGGLGLLALLRRRRK